MHYLATLVLVSVLWTSVTAAADRGLRSTCRTPSIALFVHFDAPSVDSGFNSSVSEINRLQMLTCLRNIAAAKAMLVDPLILVTPLPLYERATPLCLMETKEFRIDIHLSFAPNSMSTDMQRITKEYVATLPGVSHVSVEEEGGSSHIRSFIGGMQKAQEAGSRYDFVFKIHSHMSRRLMKHSTECLCGTPSQVVSILREFLVSSPDMDILAAQGLALTAVTPIRRVAPFLLENSNDKLYMNRISDLIKGGASSLATLFEAVIGKPLNLSAGQMLMVQGGVYWMRQDVFHHGMFNKMAKEMLIFNIIKEKELNKAVIGDSHLLPFDQLIPALALHRGRRVASMIPAPKPLSIYFPQYHRIPENDKFWGENFTEWTLLEPLDLPLIMKPLGIRQGGLGYYNLTHRGIRQMQGIMNKQYAGYGFVYYHYWFCGEGAPEDHKILYKIPELMLLDGEPNTPFMFSWANEPWTRRWTGKTKDTMLAQDYGGEKEWKEHFDYLLSFFRHENYIQVNGMPVFVIYRLDHLGRKLRAMLKLWNRMAVDAGFSSGIYFVVTMGNFWNLNTEQKVVSVPEIKAAFQFWPMITGNFPDFKQGSDFDISVPQYWGAFTGFDPRPRRPTISRRFDISPAIFEESLKISTNCSDVQRWRSLEDNFLFITAWNEWNEQATMEPNTLYGNGFLSSMRYAMQTVPSCSI